MGALPSELRTKLERAIIEARETSESGAKAALEALAVHHHEPYPHMKSAQRELRVALRAHARQLGDQQNPNGELTINHLVQECAYEHWHRMLFARFLAENGLLIEPESGMAISLGEAEALAKSAKVDLWSYASRCAQRMLPQIFRPDDPLLQVTLANEHRVKLEHLLAGIDPAAFKADDALGWVYQFWQSRKKDEINDSEVKIGADEIPAVTQLFTEPYMVEFLLHNTLGAWWAGKYLTAADAESAEVEQELRQKVSLPGVTWDYLRFVRTQLTAEGAEDTKKKNPESQPLLSAVKGRWRPAAGTFDGWPRTAAEIKVLDPCCGSGHFLVAALHHLVPIRMAEEGLSAADAVDAVLRDNIFGLEIDERCCQIAAFALALAAWKISGWKQLPPLNIACTGIGPQCSAEQWLKLAEDSGIPMPADGREPIKNGLLNLHQLFSQAPTLGSLINPAELPADLIAADYETIQPYLAAALEAEKADIETRERAVAAAGMVKAASLLASEYTLVITNVPYLGRAKQNAVLRSHLQEHYPAGKADLATAFLLRCLEACSAKGSVALVTPQNWLFLTRYTELRKSLLRGRQWNVVARLGPGAFETIGGHVVNVALLALSEVGAAEGHRMAGIDVSSLRSPAEKTHLLRGVRAEVNDQPAHAETAPPYLANAPLEAASGSSETRQQAAVASGRVTVVPGEIRLVPQAAQRRNPDARIISESVDSADLLVESAVSPRGIVNGDNERWTRNVWEILSDERWRPLQGAVTAHQIYGGRNLVIDWATSGRGMLRPSRGNVAYGKHGVAISRMGNLPCSLYTGEFYDQNTAVVVPSDPSHTPALWAYCSSGVFVGRIRQIDSKINVTPVTLLKVPFDLAHWQKAAAVKFPNGLPEPESDDPTQWLFHGYPGGKVDAACRQLSDEQKQQDAATALQVAVARLLGYRWPAELDDKMRLSQRARALLAKCQELAKFADDDGIVCIPSVRGEDPAADRLLALLSACGMDGSPLQAAGGRYYSLDEWLRNSYFEEHCKLFHHRPFVWHIWDGRQHDGFHALVNYHKLAEAKQGRKLLEKLAYTYLGDWISRQESGVKRGDDGAEDRLAAAKGLQNRLAAILEGEPPFDIFVRWKPLAEQPIGWEPDINDGVRMNIRPFLAGDQANGRSGAGVLRWKPNIKWDKDRGKEPQRKKEEFPWFWGWDGKAIDFMGGREFKGERFNDCHYTVAAKRKAREDCGR